MIEKDSVYIIFKFIEPETGKEIVQEYALLGTDHKQAVKEMAERVIPKGMRVHQIHTFDGPPRNWDWGITVTERV